MGRDWLSRADPCTLCMYHQFDGDGMNQHVVRMLCIETPLACSASRSPVLESSGLVSVSMRARSKSTMSRSYDAKPHHNQTPRPQPYEYHGRTASVYGVAHRGNAALHWG
jgi:hypothetical protein